jgi:hypothetical protein
MPTAPSSNPSTTAPDDSATAPDGPDNIDPDVPATGTSIPDGTVAIPSAEPVAPDPDGDSVQQYQPPATIESELGARTWRLTQRQYELSVQALFDVVPDTQRFTADLDNGVFVNFSDTGFVRLDQNNAYFAVAQDVSDQVSEAVLASFGGQCTLDAACRDAFVSGVVNAAFRRPPTADELVSYGEIFDLGAESGDPLLGFRSVVKALLTSPHFLYRTEIGAEQDETQTAFSLTDHEVATLLSYSLLGRPPTPALSAAADAGTLTQPGGLADAVAELVALPEAQEQFETFLEQWLEVYTFDSVEKFEDTYPGFLTQKERIWQETADFFAAKGSLDSTLTALLSDPLTPSAGVGGADLVEFYSSDESGGELGTRVGVLSLGSVMASHAKPNLTSPTLRGTFVRRRFLCQNITLPAINIPPLSETEDKGEALSTRELYEMHAKDALCAGCHTLTDNIGFAFENFDGAGRYRTLDTTQGDSVPIDPVAKLVGTDVNRMLTGPTDLAAALSESELVRQCLSIQAFRYYFGQGESSLGLAPIVGGHAALQQSGVLGDLVKALWSTDATFKRRRD